jgi:YidC/Oxa1 family membrane protein insertase
MYRGLNGMAELPVTSMQTGGLLWFTDLTIQDPFYALPLMTVATLFITVEVGTR